MIPILMCRNKQKGLWLPHSDIQSLMKERVCPLHQIIGYREKLGEKTYSNKCHSERHLFAYFNLFLSLVMTQT